MSSRDINAPRTDDYSFHRILYKFSLEQNIELGLAGAATAELSLPYRQI